MDLMAACYALTRRLPLAVRTGIASGLRRASLSIATSIADATGRRTRPEYLHHLAVARGSLDEIRSLLRAAERLGYVEPAEVRLLAGQVDETGRRLLSLTRAAGGGGRA